MNGHKPRIVVDARMVGPIGHGIANYVQQIADGLNSLVRPYDLIYLIHTSCPADSILRQLPHSETEIAFLHSRELLALRREIELLEPALYHSPSFSSLFSYPCPHLQTVHDLNHRHFGNWQQKAYYRWVLLPSLRKAKAVISVSDSAAEEIRDWLWQHHWRDTVHVVKNPIVALPVTDDPAILHKHNLRPGEYFLCVANGKPHKNLALLEQAYLAACQEFPLRPLVCTLDGPASPGIRRVGSLGPPEHGALTRQARALFSPSLYEGFGRAPLEAALAGILPVVSDISVHREVLAGVKETVFLDPANKAKWSRAFLPSANFPEGTSAVSQEWVAETYSLANISGRMDQIYQRVLASV